MPIGPPPIISRSSIIIELYAIITRFTILSVEVSRLAAPIQNNEFRMTYVGTSQANKNNTP
ncbi:hypothetical protein GCM10022392_11410 [Mucilaginibacter panaciglaebae]|uniref:Uncharacterized protein n=1 Tax=Mucilaginibacter panaciglaebae TaxID=502331 RepID=A0ABP7WLD8_9SPHI